MLSAYLDECGQESKGLVIVGGFIGEKSAWDRFALLWPEGFKGTQRKSLHLRTLRFERDSERLLLKRLGPIPEQCGLTKIYGSVNEADYRDLVEGTVAELHAHGYALALVPLIHSIRRIIPPEETYELIFEEQTALGFYRERMLQFISHILSHDPAIKSGEKRIQLTGWRTMTKRATRFFEPADYLCYYLAHNSTEPGSVKVSWTAPIMGDGIISPGHLTKDAARELFVMAPFLRPQSQSELQYFKKFIRQGHYDPWEELLEERKAKS